MEYSTVLPMIKMRTEKHRSEFREAFYKDKFSVRRMVTVEQPQLETPIFQPLNIFQLKEWILQIKERVREISQCELKRDIQMLNSLVFLLLEDLRKSPIPNFSSENLEEINIFPIFKLVASNLEYQAYGDLVYNFVWSVGILLNKDGVCFEFIKENNVLDFYFFLMKKTEKTEIQAMSCFVIGELCKSHLEARDYCLKLNVLKFISSFFQRSEVPQFLFEELLALCNNMIQKPLPLYEELRMVLPLLTQSIDESLIKHLSDETIVEVLFSLSEISSGPQNQIDDLIFFKVHERTVALCLKYPLPKMIGRYSLRILGNLVSEDNSACEKVVDAGLLKVLELYASIREINDEMVMELCWIVSNLLACGEELIKRILKDPFSEHILRLPMRNKDKKFLKEGSMIVFNISKGAVFSQILTFGQLGLFELIDFILETNDKDILLCLLKAIKKILKKESQFSDARISNRQYYFKEELEKRGIEKRIRELLTYEDREVFYWTDLIMQLIEKE